MGYSLEIKKYDEETNKKIMKQNIDYTFDKEKFNWYEGIFKLDDDEIRIPKKTIDGWGASYSTFISLYKILLNVIKKEIPNQFKIIKSNFGEETWECEDEKLTKEQNEFFKKIVPFINYSGDSSGWTWTYNEIKNLKDILVKENHWKELEDISTMRLPGIDLKELFEIVIKEKGVLELW